ncbi:hypothetical protein W97_08799 [Coniosporium apollinis CBS 100218]|uniref:Uncharacterized protein n=1 Tax=Coniosporium apollinis (strain CBS 100218) TaxID=1168221 RepID=R7Z693_CONA1|nr:uncharacterized protein W97_08799 [Coniosporium apollinis CBS 100218]EON69539.1 hypothetical protein W97_08799 [Coniosporium apollinis CBS 100218]
MPRQKQPGKADKHAKRKPSAPETEDEFLETADELEKSGGKWRAGDAAKAMRFFQRAIDTYGTGLQQYPRSFDLAYNKALLQYQMTQDHRIASQLGDPINLLRETLESHRYARQLNEENADILFNTAQVLTSLAEARAEDVEDAESRSDAVRLLQEAVELFSACLTRQEMEYSEQQAAAVEAASTATDTDAEDVRDTTDTVETSPDSPEAEQWATVVEPVTPGTLLETALAQLSALSTLVSLTTSSTVSALGFIRELASPLLVTKIPSYLSLISTDCPNPIMKEEPSSASARSISVTEPNPQPVADATQEPPPHVTAALAISAYTAAIADAEYRAGLTTADDYGARLTNAYEPLLSEDRYQAAPSKPFTAVLGAYADALSDLASSLAGLDRAKHKPNQKPSQHAALRWQALTRAQELLTAASKQETANAEKARIYLARGDVGLGRFQLASLPDAAASLVKSREVLLKNAGVYYRGAAGLARQSFDTETVMEATVKEAVAQVQAALFRNDAVAQSSAIWEKLLSGTGRKQVLDVVREMQEDGLIAEELVKQLVG